MAETTSAAGSEKTHRNENEKESEDAAARSDEEVTDGKAAAVAGDDETANYPGPLALSILMVGISAACFIVALDRTIVATAIPQITDRFNSPDDVGWYGSAYLLVS